MPDMIDRLLSLGSTPDWIRPLVGIIKDFTNGPYYRFYVDRNAGWSVNAIKRLLNSYGVHVWGDIIANDMIIFTVRQAQAQWAQYLLQRAGVPILNRPIEGGSGFARSTSTKAASTNVWKAFLDWLDD
jgi:hypothetical protein